MLRSILNCLKTVSALILVSVILTACGGTGGLPEMQASTRSAITVANSSKDLDSEQEEIDTANGSNSSTRLSNSSVRNATESKSSARTSSVGSTLSGTINRSTSNVQASSRDTLSGTIDRSGSSLASLSNKSTQSTSKQATVINSSVAISSKASSVAISSKASSIAFSSKASSIAFSSKASSVAVSSKASSSKVSSSSASSKMSSSVASSSKSSSSRASSSKASSSVTSKASSSASKNLLGALGATIQWAHPTARENGSYLNLGEIGGYQIRYKTINSLDYSYINIPGNGRTQYTFPLSIIGLQFEIAVYDNQGLYSDFVPIPAN